MSFFLSNLQNGLSGFSYFVFDVRSDSGNFPDSDGPVKHFKCCVSGGVFGVKRVAPRTSYTLRASFVLASRAVVLGFSVLTYSLSGQDANCLVLCSCFQMSEELSELHQHDFYAFDGEILDMARTKNP